MSYIGKQPLVTPSSFTAQANGAISDGDPCVIDSAGTIAAIFENSVTEALGTQTQVNDSSSEAVSASYDSSANKVVIFWQDSSNVYGRVVTIDPSDNSLSFGTEASFAESTAYRYTGHHAVYDDANDKHVYTYSISGAFKAVVATVSGTSLSFGTAVTISSSNVSFKSTTYDSGSNKVIVAYRDIGNSSYGTCQVGTVSGTSISFGSKSVFQSGTTGRISAEYDSTNDKTLIAYMDDTNEYGRAVVGTVSGTSISFGSEATFWSNSIEQYPSTYFDSERGQVIVFFSNNSYYPTVIAGTISGTSVTFGTGVVVATHGANRTSADYDSFAKKGVILWLHEVDTDTEYALVTNSGSALTVDTPVSAFDYTTQFTAVAYDANAKRVFLAANNSAVSPVDLDARVLAVPYVEGNLTAENFIGFADADYADGATATVQLSGAVDDAQSGLTAGQQYFVQADGTLGTTADDPSVIAGVALSATEIAIDTGRD